MNVTRLVIARQTVILLPLCDHADVTISLSLSLSLSLSPAGADRAAESAV